MNPIVATWTGKSNTDDAFVVDVATPADQAAIAANLENVQHWLASRDVALGTAPFIEEWIERKLAGGEFYVARNRGIPISTLRLLWANPDFRDDRCRGDLASIHALAEWRDYAKRGFGARLTHWPGRQAITDGRRLLRLDRGASHSALGTYYRRLEFTSPGSRGLDPTRVTLFEKNLFASRYGKQRGENMRYGGEKPAEEEQR